MYAVHLNLKHEAVDTYASKEEALGVAQFIANQLSLPAYVVVNSVTLVECRPKKAVEA